jgi:trimeric autotransporter adhesin
MELCNITAKGVDGNLVFYTSAGDIIATWDNTNRKLSLPSGSTLEVLGAATIVDAALSPNDLALAEGSVLVGNNAGKAVALSAKSNTQILVGNGTTIASVAMSGDASMANTGAVTIANDAITTAKILNGNVTSAKLAAGAGVAALLTAGLGGSVSCVKTDAATKTIVAAHGTKDRACLVLVVVDETYAIGTGTLPTVEIGEDDTIDKCMAHGVLDTEAAGTVLAFAFTNTATKKIIATATAAVGNATGGCSITVLAIPTT